MTIIARNFKELSVAIIARNFKELSVAIKAVGDRRLIDLPAQPVRKSSGMLVVRLV